MTHKKIIKKAEDEEQNKKIMEKKVINIAYYMRICDISYTHKKKNLHCKHNQK